MRISISALVGAAAVAFLVSAAQASDSRASMAGLGAIRIGMGIPALERALGTRLPETQDAEDDACRQVEAGPSWPGTSVMLLKGRVARIDVNERGTLTLSGAAVGDTQASVIKRYGRRLSSSAHAYGVDDSKYLTMFSSDHRYGIRFETDGERITSYYVGTAEAVQFIEGCV
ncbi:MAG: hypothetical protein ABI588_03525 [Arenimonas sp.]